ncbi:MAG: chemotaxis protein CheW [Leptospira sp.]|nr:chemotaxis protein CheW [Leptospira sp.]
MIKEKTESLQLLTWYIGNQLFGMNITECREVDQDNKILEVPHSKEYVRGIMNLRGDVVTVLDLRSMLGYSAKENNISPVAIRLKGNNQQVAILADSICDVMEIENDKIEPCPPHMSELETRYISAITMTDRGNVLILNPAEVVKVK